MFARDLLRQREAEAAAFRARTQRQEQAFGGSSGTPRPSSTISANTVAGAASPMRTPCSAQVRKVTFAAPASIALRTRFHVAWVGRSASPSSSGRLGS